MILALLLAVAPGEPALAKAAGLRTAALTECTLALSDPAPEVRIAALHCLGKRSKAGDAADVASRLVAALADPNEDVSATARLLLVRFEPETAAATASVALRVEIASELGRLLLSRVEDGSARRARHHLVLSMLCDDDEPAVRSEAEATLERVLGKY